MTSTETENFPKLVLVLGDTHIPHRKSDLPDKFKSLLVPGKIAAILCTGNLCSKEFLDQLKLIAKQVHVVRGDMDDDSKLPDTKIINIDNFKIGLCHGHQIVPWGDIESLGALQRQLDCDILITGHTHHNDVVQYEGRYMINPGSATGAYSSLSGECLPSFVLMAIKGSSVETYVYELKADELVVSKTTFNK